MTPPCGAATLRGLVPGVQPSGPAVQELFQQANAAIGHLTPELAQDQVMVQRVEAFGQVHTTTQVTW